MKDGKNVNVIGKIVEKENCQIYKLNLQEEKSMVQLIIDSNLMKENYQDML